MIWSAGWFSYKSKQTAQHYDVVRQTFLVIDLGKRKCRRANNATTKVIIAITLPENIKNS